MEVAGVSQPGELAMGRRWRNSSSRETHLGGAESGTLGRDRGMGAEEDFLGRISELGKVCLFVTWGFLWRGVGTTLAHGGEEEKKEPRREKGEKPLWQEEGAGISRRGKRGRRRGEVERGVGVRDCMTEVIKAGFYLHRNHTPA